MKTTLAALLFCVLFCAALFGQAIQTNLAATGSWYSTSSIDHCGTDTDYTGSEPYTEVFNITNAGQTPVGGDQLTISCWRFQTQWPCRLTGSAVTDYESATLFISPTNVSTVLGPSIHNGPNDILLVPWTGDMAVVGTPQQLIGGVWAWYYSWTVPPGNWSGTTLYMQWWLTWEESGTGPRAFSPLACTVAF